MFQKLRSKLFTAAQEGRFSRSFALRPFSGLWSIGAKIKNTLYDWNLLRVHRLSVPVISVGNLVAGGSGKTPLVHLLAKTLGPVAILSRGYRSKESGLPLGDELTLLSRHLPEARFYIGKDRVDSGKRAIAEGAKLILLDDGFQYRRLYRDFELLIVDGANPFGYGAFLPRGLLRDSPTRLAEADALFVNGLPIPSLSSPAIGVQMQVRSILDLKGNSQLALAGKKIGIFCAIGAPHRFLTTIQGLGAQVVDHWFLPDHEKPAPDALASFANRCLERRAEALVCTEKDAVKLPFSSLSLPIHYLQAELEIISGMDIWQNLIEKISLKINN